jgi:hypothetical protein
MSAKLLGKTIYIDAEVAKEIGVNPAIMLAQAIEWQLEKSPDFKMSFTATAEEWYKATGLTYEMQAIARKKLNSTGYWCEWRKGIPAQIHYYLLKDRFIAKFPNFKNVI